MEQQTRRKWTPEEERVLIDQVRVFPQNLTKCFLIVGETIDRTPTAVASHWYTKTSKNPEVMCFFTASPVHVSKNRKNGMGEESNQGIWRRLLRVLGIRA